MIEPDELELEPLRRKLQASIEPEPQYPWLVIWVVACAVVGVVLLCVFGAPVVAG